MQFSSSHLSSLRLFDGGGNAIELELVTRIVGFRGYSLELVPQRA